MSRHFCERRFKLAEIALNRGVELIKVLFHQTLVYYLVAFRAFGCISLAS